MPMTGTETSIPLESDGNVRFKMSGHLPRWPQECVVCSQYCAETREVYSRVEPQNRYSFGGRGIRSFPVPLHVSNPDCMHRFRFLAPASVYLLLLSIMLGVGWVASTFARPGWPAHLFVFSFAAIVAGLIAVLPLSDRYQPYVLIFEYLDGEYTVGFKYEAYARKFVELNRDIVLPFDRLKWDVSINVLPKDPEH